MLLGEHTGRLSAQQSARYRQPRSQLLPRAVCVCTDTSSHINALVTTTIHYPRRARSALGVDTVLTLDVCLYVCMYVC